MTGCEGQDWAGYQLSKPSTAGLGYAFVKATEGTGYVNPKYTSQVATARSGSLVTGHYHFARLGSMSAQAAYFLAHTSIRPGDILAFDWEDTGVSSGDKDAWIKAVQAAMPGHQVGLYCNRDFWLNRDASGFYGDFLWIADPSAPKGKPRIQSPWLFHQYSEAGGIDRDYSPLTADQIKTWSHAKENDVALTAAETKAVADASAQAVMAYKVDDPTRPGTQYMALKDVIWWIGQHAGQSTTQIAALTATVQTLAAQLGKDVDTATVVAAVQQAIADAVVHVQVDVTQPAAT